MKTMILSRNSHMMMVGALLLWSTAAQLAMAQDINPPPPLVIHVRATFELPASSTRDVMMMTPAATLIADASFQQSFHKTYNNKLLSHEEEETPLILKTSLRIPTKSRSSKSTLSSKLEETVVLTKVTDWTPPATCPRCYESHSTLALSNAYGKIIVNTTTSSGHDDKIDWAATFCKMLRSSSGPVEMFRHAINCQIVMTTTPTTTNHEHLAYDVPQDVVVKSTTQQQQPQDPAAAAASPALSSAGPVVSVRADTTRPTPNKDATNDMDDGTIASKTAAIPWFLSSSSLAAASPVRFNFTVIASFALKDDDEMTAEEQLFINECLRLSYNDNHKRVGAIVKDVKLKSHFSIPRDRSRANMILSGLVDMEEEEEDDGVEGERVANVQEGEKVAAAAAKKYNPNRWTDYTHMFKYAMGGVCSLCGPRLQQQQHEEPMDASLVPFLLDDDPQNGDGDAITTTTTAVTVGTSTTTTNKKQHYWDDYDFTVWEKLFCNKMRSGVFGRFDPIPHCHIMYLFPNHPPPLQQQQQQHEQQHDYDELVRVG